MPASNPKYVRGTIYVSGTEWKLRLVSVVCWIPAGICAWLVPLAPHEEWAAAPLGSIAWWLLPAILMVLSLSLTVVLIPVHGRYVLQVVLEPDGRLRVTTFLVWGRQTETLRPDEIAARRFLLDRTADAPLGLEALETLGFIAPP